MRLKRKIDEYLIEWKKNKNKMPLIVKGARQIGKTESIKNFGVNNYKSLIEINKLFEILKTDANFLFQDTIELKEEQFSESEKCHIRKYRTLDEHGKKMVDFTLDEEYDRCTYVQSEEPAQTISIGRSALPASAGAGEFLSEENIEMREFPDCENARRADIVIPVSGDSMEPMFSDGDELYVRLQPAVEAGEIGIFIVEGKGYVKEYAEDRLISLNPDYDDVFPSEYGECRCVGKVLGKV